MEQEHAPTAGQPGPPVPGHIGQYRILRKLGEGGMGEVFEAEQEHPRRTVAVKVIRSGIFVDEARMASFKREADALARLRHPDIAVIYEAGCTQDGRNFFAMELVPGEALDVYMARRGPAGSREEVRFRLALFKRIADAVHYAHQRGVIHRDLKPSNILVVPERGADEGAQGSTVAGLRLPGVKILDFGLAKITEADVAAATLETEMGEIKGTLAYMAPEQARGDPSAIDVRTDVYALGMIAYEMLAGSRPYDLARSALFEAIRVICEQPPRPLRDTMHGMRRLDPDVETIVGKALEKEPDRRYSSAAALSEDVSRYLTSQPIVARPPSTIYHLKKFAARNRVLVGGVAATLVVLVAGATTATIFAVREAAQRLAAEQARKDLEAVVEFQAGMLADVDPEGVGRRMIADLEMRVGRVRERRGASPAEIASAKRRFEASVAGVNPTGAALRLIDDEILARATRNVEQRFGQQPLISARLLHTIGTTYDALGLYGPADQQLSRALDLRIKWLGEDHPQSLLSMKHLAFLYWNQGRYREARTLAESTLSRHERVFGEQHQETLATAHTLALVYRSLGLLDQATALVEKTLAIQRRVLGDDHPDTLNSMDQLGTLLREQGRLDLAERQLETTLAARRRVNGSDNSTTLSTLNNLAIVYHLRGRDDEAARLFAESLATKSRVLGDDHPDTLALMNNLALQYTSMRRYAEAEALHRRALAGRKRVLGEEHPDALVSMNNLANVLAEEGRIGEAETLYRETYSSRRRVLGEDHADTLASAYNLGFLLFRDLHRNAEAETLLRSALERLKRVSGFAHPDTERVRANLLDLYKEEGRSADARRLEAERLEAARITAERADATTDELNNYAWQLLTVEPAALQDPAKALGLAQQACAREEQARGANLWNYLDTLALAWHRNGNTEQAVETEKRALSLLPPGSPERTGIERQLADYLAIQTVRSNGKERRR